MSLLLNTISKHDANVIALRDATSTLTWGELVLRLNSIVEWWNKEDNIMNSKNIYIFLENDVDSILCLLSALIMGKNVALIDPNISAAKWEEIFSETDFQLILGSAQVIQCLGLEDYALTVQQIVTNRETAVQSFNRYFNDEGSVFFLTSGSTGKHKLVQRKVSSLLSEGKSYGETLNLTEHDAYLAALPLHHAFACGCALFGSIFNGGTLVLSSLFFPRAILKWIYEYKITVLPLIPSLVKLMTASYTKPLKVEHLRYALIGTGQISTSLAELFYSLYGVRLSGNYGSSETGGIAMRLPEVHPYLNLVGQAMSGVDIIIEDDNGLAVPYNIEGNVTVRTSSLFCGYVGENQDVQLPAKHERWSTGDIGHLTEDGMLYISGRKSNLLQRNGKKINPVVIENALLCMPNIAEAVVIGLDKKETYDDLITAVIVPKVPVLNEAQIRGYCLQQLEAYMTPEKVVFVSQIPRTVTGKVDRVSLIESLTCGKETI
ncbi:class I adenylate-forming enzyme family protein [Paenibacillus sp. NPDC057934]|uniref:class I adenylate-forming enzyme family protein n=1 Tax=Paenibacillus sp. NPDC057934 TaxID=3346282 RepID=UPI0036DC9263